MGAVARTIRTRGRPQGAGATLVERSSFQPFSVPSGLPRNGDSPKYRAFPEVAKINIDGGRGSQVLMEVPATAPASWEPGEVHLRRWDILNHCMKTDQGSVGVNIRRVVERERRDLSSNPESLWAVARNGDSPVGLNPACERQWRSGT